MTKKIFLLFFAIFSFNCHAQNETCNWYFGNQAGLNFSGSSPSILLNSAMTASAGSSSISDSAGNLLFYTNGVTIWNQNHSIMANGTGLLGNVAAQYGPPVLIVKKPGSSTLYYIFTIGPGNVSAPLALRYSIVDMSLAAGLGSVTVLNNVLTSSNVTSSNVTSALAAVKHCNGSNVWIATTSFQSGNTDCYLLTSNGLNLTPVSSTPGLSSCSCTSTYLKFSQNGKKIAALRNAILEVYDFDNSTGTTSNGIFLNTFFSLSGDGFQGFEFSPDGSKFYAAGSGAGFPLTSKIQQWDLCTNSSSLGVIASSYTVFTASAGIFSRDCQLAQDGKIYIGLDNQSSLAVINNPNLSGAACNFVNYQQSIAPRITKKFLPSFPSGFISQQVPSPPFTHTVSLMYGCQTASFTAPPVVQNFTQVPCTASNYSLVGFQWTFGDPASGANNLSGIANPWHTFSSPGNYTVSLVLYHSCGGANDTIKQVVNVSQPCISVGNTSITCASLGSATVTALNGIGPYSYSWTPTAQSGSVATGLNPGTYTITVFDAGNNLTYTALTVFTSLIPLTASLSASSSLACNGAFTGTGLFTNVNGGSANQNYFWTNGTQTSTVSNPTNLSAGIWSVNVTDALTGCQINQSFLITQPPPLVLNLSANTPTACAGFNIILTGTNSGGTPITIGAGYTYTWTNAPPSNTVSVSENTAGVYVYTLQSTDANNCLSSNTIAVSFIANPVLSVSDVSICPLAIGTLTASGASSYTWMAPGTSTPLSAQGPTMTATPSSNSQYTVLGSALGCTSMATASIILFPVPVPTLQTNSPRCEGTSLFINAAGGAMYQWFGPNAFSSFLPNNTFTNLALSDAGVYNVIVTSVNGCTASASTTIIVNPTPTVSAAGSTVCTSQTLSLFANSLGSSFIWSGPLNFNSSVQNPTVGNPVVSRSGTYTVKALSVPGCTNAAIAIVSVIPPPSLSVALSSGSLCSQAFNGSPNTITLTASGGNSYTLFTPNLIGSSTPVTPTTSMFSTPPFSNTLAVGTATLEGSNGVCSSQSTFVFTVVPNPTVGVNSYTPVICAGENFTYTSNSANSYVWTATTPNYTTYSNGGVAVAHPSINAMFSVYGSSLGCNSALQTSTITVNPIPTLTVSAASNSICLYESTKLSISGTGTSFTWSPSTGLNNTYAATVVAAPLGSQMYTVFVSANNCTNFANLYLTVLALPIPKINVITPAVCLGEQISLNGNGGVSYDWRGPDQLFLQGAIQNFKAISPAYAGNYTLTVTDVNGCKSSTVANVQVLDLPSGSFSDFDEEVCVPYCANYNFVSINKNQKLNSTWLVNGQKYSGNQFSKCFATAGTFSIQGKFTDPTTTCSNTVEYLITVRPKPKADFIYAPKNPIEGLDEVVFTNTSTGDNLTTFNWFFTNNKGYTSKDKNTSYLYMQPGIYNVAVVTKNQWHCADTIVKTIKIENDFAIYVPNTFTPNEDQRNDIFLPVIRSVKIYDLKIFDRWGQEIFHSKSIEDGWDGTFHGEVCKQDVYTWVIELSTLEGERVSKTGTVMLLR